MKWTLPTKREGLSLNLSLFFLFGLTMVLSTCGTASTRTAVSALPTSRPAPRMDCKVPARCASRGQHLPKK